MACMCFCLFCSHSDLDLRQCDILVAKKIGLAYNVISSNYVWWIKKFVYMLCIRRLQWKRNLEKF